VSFTCWSATILNFESLWNFHYNLSDYIFSKWFIGHMFWTPSNILFWEFCLLDNAHVFAVLQVFIINIKLAFLAPVFGLICSVSYSENSCGFCWKFTLFFERFPNGKFNLQRHFHISKISCQTY
jgi:hypothetical protein